MSTNINDIIKQEQLKKEKNLDKNIQESVPVVSQVIQDQKQPEINEQVDEPTEDELIINRQVYYQFDRDTTLIAEVINEITPTILDLQATHSFQSMKSSRISPSITTREFLKVSKGSKNKIGTWFEIE